MHSLALAFPVTPGKEQEWRYWGKELRGVRRPEYLAFRRKVGLIVHRLYFQHSPRGDLAIFYLEGKDLKRVFHELQTAQDSFVVWLRQWSYDLLNGLDVTQTPLESLSVLAFDGPRLEVDEARGRSMEEMGHHETMDP